MTAYRLYAMPTTPAALDGMGPQRFARITPDYSLVYTDKEKPHGSVEMKEEDATRLTAADENWLLSCNLTLIKEEIERKKPELLMRLAEKLENMEALLEELNKEAQDGEDADKE